LTDGPAQPPGPEDEGAALLDSLTDTRLYSIGAYFCDQHPDLIDEVVAQGEAMEGDGLERYARAEGLSLEEAFQTLMTALAVRYYKAVTGPQP